MHGYNHANELSTLENYLGQRPCRVAARCLWPL